MTVIGVQQPDTDGLRPTLQVQTLKDLSGPGPGPGPARDEKAQEREKDTGF